MQREVPKGDKIVRPVRVVLRDGVPVMLKACRTCGEDKVCVDGPESEVSPNVRRADGTVRSWALDCKLCAAVLRTARRQANLEAERAAARKRYANQMRNPERRAARRRQGRERAQRERADPVLRAKLNARQRKYRARLQREERERLNAEQRLRYRMRRERDGFKPRVLNRPSGAPRLDAEPITLWLESYSERSGLTTAAELGADLGINPRRVSGLRNGQTDGVTLDIVDCALLHARYEVDVELDGELRTVFAIEDLYPDVFPAALAA